MKMVDDGPWLYYKFTNEPKGLPTHKTQGGKKEVKKQEQKYKTNKKKKPKKKPKKKKKKKKKQQKKQKKNKKKNIPTLFQNKGGIVNKTFF